MCGRISLTHSWNDLATFFRVQSKPDPPFSIRYNIAPGQDVLALKAGSDESRCPIQLRWGLIPHWAREEKISYRMINARSESAANKPAFRDPLRHRRCIIPASSFFEWKTDGKVKTPFNIRLKSSHPLALAGLWDQWKTPTGETIESCAILTTVANHLVAPIHDRMPVILPPEKIDFWLSHLVQEAEALRFLFRPYPPDQMEMYPISSQVNNPANDVPGCIEPLGLKDTGTLQ